MMWEGEFVLYRHTALPYSVHAFYKRCGRASCNCAVAVKACDDVIVIDRCVFQGVLGGFMTHNVDNPAGSQPPLDWPKVGHPQGIKWVGLARA
jgi:hypothetical protein